MNIANILSDMPVPNGSGGYQGLFPTPHNLADDTLVQGADGNWYPVDAKVCNRIICGFMPQSEAGFNLLYACSMAGFVGARAGCADPWCSSWAAAGECQPQQSTEPLPEYGAYPGWNAIPFYAPPIAKLPVQTLVPPVPSIVAPPQSQIGLQSAAPSPGACGFAGWVNQNPILAAALVAGGFFLLKK